MTVRVALKNGVEVRGVSPESVLAIALVANVFDAHGVPMVLTSIKDGKHRDDSIHYVGGAFDLRLPSRYTGEHLTDKRIADEIRESLGDSFDVVLETDHIHVEHDPKVTA